MCVYLCLSLCVCVARARDSRVSVCVRVRAYVCIVYNDRVHRWKNVTLHRIKVVRSIVGWFAFQPFPCLKYKTKGGGPGGGPFCKTIFIYFVLSFSISLFHYCAQVCAHVCLLETFVCLFFLHCRQVDRFDCSCVLYMRHSVIGRVVQCEIRECFDVITDDDDKWWGWWWW